VTDETNSAALVSASTGLMPMMWMFQMQQYQQQILQAFMLSLMEFQTKGMQDKLLQKMKHKEKKMKAAAGGVERNADESSRSSNSS
jgi:hypothetical protein